MIIRKYGVTLRRLTEEDIELVRAHRNSVEIQEQMFYREEITPESQQKWFASINNAHNHYFIIEHKGEKIGLIFGKNDNYTELTSEGGIFIWNKKAFESMVPVIASIVFTELTFTFREMKKIYATLRIQNSRAINYIRQMGYCLELEDKAEGKAIYTLTHSDFVKKTEKIKKTIARLTNDFSEISERDIFFESTLNEKQKLLYSSYPEYLRAKIEKLRVG
ncbi:MAG: GNAT family N-acetyltransferase [Bacteroidia bacterium]|nr:GNAT family N-acetyltransferase [Bacteroidia bacterium]